MVEAESGSLPAPVGRGCRCLGSFMGEAARGRDDIGSAEALSGDCMDDVLVDGQNGRLSRHRGSFYL